MVTPDPEQSCVHGGFVHGGHELLGASLSRRGVSRPAPANLRQRGRKSCRLWPYQHTYDASRALAPETHRRLWRRAFVRHSVFDQHGMPRMCKCSAPAPEPPSVTASHALAPASPGFPRQLLQNQSPFQLGVEAVDMVAAFAVVTQDHLGLVAVVATHLAALVVDGRVSGMLQSIYIAPHRQLRAPPCGEPPLALCRWRRPFSAPAAACCGSVPPQSPWALPSCWARHQPSPIMPA